MSDAKPSERALAAVKAVLEDLVAHCAAPRDSGPLTAALALIIDEHCPERPADAELLAVCGEVDDYFGEDWEHDDAWAAATNALQRRVCAALAAAKEVKT